MKKALVFALTLLLASNAFAVVKKPRHAKPAPRPQQEERATTLKIGWYVAPVLKVSEIRKEVEPMVGLRGGLEFNRNIYLGIAGYGLPRNNHHHDWSYDYYGPHDYSQDWELGYGGLEFGIISGKPRSGQLSVGALIGGGGTNEHHIYDYYGHYENYDGTFFVFEPQLDLLVNLSQNVRLSLGGSYRFIDNVKSERYTQDDLQGPAFNIAIAFGCF